MPFTKVWSGATGDYSLATNWQAISVRTAAWSWTASGSGTNEYYLRTAASGNPGFQASPANVYINGSSATSGTPGSLAAGRWGYGDNDTLGYSTIYVRLSDGADPDSKAADYVTFYQVPKATESVIIPVSGGVTISSNLDAASTAIDKFVVESDWTGTIGSATNFLRIDPDSFDWRGGSGYIDLGATAIPLSIGSTARAATGRKALYLRGSALTTIDIAGGSVGLAATAGDTLTATTLRVGGSSDVLCGLGCTLTNLDLLGGSVELNASATTINVYGGILVLSGAAGFTTLNLFGGTVRYYSTADATTINQYGGLFNERGSGDPRTITNYNLYGGQFEFFKEAVTHTNFNLMRSGRGSFIPG